VVCGENLLDFGCAQSGRSGGGREGSKEKELPGRALSQFVKKYVKGGEQPPKEKTRR